MTISTVVKIVVALLERNGMDESQIQSIQRFSKVKRPELSTIGDMWSIQLGYSQELSESTGAGVITMGVTRRSRLGVIDVSGVTTSASIIETKWASAGRTKGVNKP